MPWYILILVMMSWVTVVTNEGHYFMLKESIRAKDDQLALKGND